MQIFNYSLGVQDCSISNPLLLQENESQKVTLFGDTCGQAKSYLNQEYLGAHSLSCATSEIAEKRLSVSSSDKTSARYKTTALTDSQDHLPVSYPVSVENSLGNSGVYCQLRQNSSIGQASSIDRFDTSHPRMDENEENEIISQAGDGGDKSLSRKGSQRGSGRVYADEAAVFPVTNSDIVIARSKHNDLLHAEQDEEKELSPSCEYIAYLVHLAVFGILGVLTRSLLQKLFGPSIAGVTNNGSILYLDLPSNMVGSFLMGWLGVVFKSNISRVSDQLAVGLSTGYLGSLTTFSGWNQKMLDLSVNGQWVFAVLGFILGLLLAAGSISFGVETAKGFKWLLSRVGKNSGISNWGVNRYKCNLVILLVLILMWAGLWTTGGILVKKKFKDGGSGAQLWLACFVGPLGVWIRWWLARLNGRGLGRTGLLKWIPFGTLIANVSAACVMAALATVKKAVNTTDCDTIATGIQFGLMGCLSTVSTLMAEFNALRKSSHPLRAYAYAALTIGISFSFGTLIYSVPVWIQ